MGDRFALSNTAPGVAYQLRQGPDGWECACKGFYWRKECKHASELARALPVHPASVAVPPEGAVRLCAAGCGDPTPDGFECVNCLLFPYEDKHR